MRWKRLCVWALLTALMTGLLPAAPLASADQTAEKHLRVKVLLAEEIRDNAPYKRSGKTYERDWITPEIDGSFAVLYGRTNAFNTYIYPLKTVNGEVTVRLRFPGVSGLTTAYLNGKKLSAASPVTVNLTDAADLRLADGKKCTGVKLIFTTLPVVSLTTVDDVARAGTEGSFLLVDPDYAAHGWQQPQFLCDAVVSRRGQSASQFSEKHPFNVSLMKDGEKWDQRLLGMRKDSDWLLDSAYNDALRMRNRVLMDLWEEIYTLPWSDQLSGANHGRFAEVVINGRYKGIYVLAEKQDRKQLGLKKTGNGPEGLLLKTHKALTKEVSVAGFFSMGDELPGSRVITEWNNVRIKYPKQESVTEDTWRDFYELVRLTVEGSDEEFAEKVGDYIDLKNFALYYVFINAMDVSDNMRKNMTFARYSPLDKLIVVPWDMDASLGRYYSSKKSRVKGWDTNPLFERLIALDVDGFNKRLNGIWITFRDTTLSVDHLMETIEKYYDILKPSGALEREKALYPSFTSYLGSEYSYSFNIEKEMTYIRSFMEKRREWSDEQFKDPY